MTDGQYLFSDGALDEALEGAKREMQQEIHSAAEDYLLNVDIDEWVAHLVEKHQIEPLAVRRDEMFFEDLGEAQVDVRYDHVQRAIFDYSGPVYIAGRAVELHIPFAGDPGLLRLRPRTFTHNPPQAGVKGTGDRETLQLARRHVPARSQGPGRPARQLDRAVRQLVARLS